MNAGAIADRLGVTGWPAVAEEMIIERDARLNRSIGARYHAQHVSSGASAAIIRRARAEGQPVSGEASPHHLLLTEEAIDEYGTQAKMNPPLRTAADVGLLKDAVADGTITVLATDHAPHPAATKAVDLASASFGIVGLECALALYVRALVDDGVVGWPEMLAMMTVNAADLLGPAGAGRGRLEPGAPGDVTVIDPDLAWTIDTADFASTGRNCPFDGWPVRGRAIATIVGGAVRHLRTADRAT
jgi:dihydroorotase